MSTDEYVDVAVSLCKKHDIRVKSSSDELTQESSSSWFGFGKYSGEHKVEPAGRGSKSAYKLIRDLDSDEEEILMNRIRKVLRKYGETRLSSIRRDSSLERDVVRTIKRFIEDELGYEIDE